MQAIAHRPVKMFRIKVVCELAGVNPSTIYRWVRAGRFPPPVQLGPNSIAWRESDVEEWQAARERITYEEERPRAVRKRTR